jgi:hypothetical protein
MKSIRTALAVVAFAGVLAGCTVGGTGTAAPTTAPTTSAAPSGSAAPSVPPTGTGGGAAGPEEQAVEATLRTYQGAIAGGDYAGACSLTSVEASAQLVAAVQAGGGQVADCPQALAAVFSQIGAPGAAAEAASTTMVSDVTVEGLNATITWTSTRQGEPRTDSATLQSVGGRWLIAGGA